MMVFGTVCKKGKNHKQDVALTELCDFQTSNINSFCNTTDECFLTMQLYDFF